MTATRRHTARLTLETLETRELMSASPIVAHQGVVQNTVAPDVVFYGPAWSRNLTSVRDSVTAALKSVGHSSYLDTLSNGGYGSFKFIMPVEPSGRWFSTVTSGAFVSAAAAASNSPANVITDGQVQAYLANALEHPFTATNRLTDAVLPNDPSRLYLVVVDPSYQVQDYNGAISTGYHNIFTLDGQVVHYAVVATPGGTAGNPAIPGVINSVQDTVTGLATREMLDAMTDPQHHTDNPSLSFGWCSASGTEVGDSNSYVCLNNVLVARPLSMNLFPMTPAAAAAAWDPSLGADHNYPTFMLDTTGNLWERYKEMVPTPAASGGAITTGTPTVQVETVLIATHVVGVSDQGIDNAGRAMVCYITNTTSNLAGREAYEYHDGGTSVLLYSPATGDNSPLAPNGDTGRFVASVRAGQGVSYVLMSDHVLFEYTDATGAVTVRATNVRAIDSGTSARGTNVVGVIYNDAAKSAFELADDKSQIWMANGVTSLSVGRQGRTALVFGDESARVWAENLYGLGLNGLLNEKWSDVGRVYSGFQANGDYALDIVSEDAKTLIEMDYNWDLSAFNEQFASHTTPNGVIGSVTGFNSLSKMRAGVLDMIFADGAFEGTIGLKQELLGTNIKRAV
jgi:hypothetical protein